MGKKASATTPTFKPAKAENKGKAALCKLAFGKIPVETVNGTIADLMEKAKAAGHKPVSARGTVTLY